VAKSVTESSVVAHLLILDREVGLQGKLRLSRWEVGFAHTVANGGWCCNGYGM
jgi:hypothetical protein